MLRCEECGVESKTADHWSVLLTDADEGWAAYLTADDDVAVRGSSPRVGSLPGIARLAARGKTLRAVCVLWLEVER